MKEKYNIHTENLHPAFSLSGVFQDTWSLWIKILSRYKNENINTNHALKILPVRETVNFTQWKIIHNCSLIKNNAYNYIIN